MLTLPIKKKWFDMILSGEKKEEYRNYNDYYMKRFYTCKNCRNHCDGYCMSVICRPSLYICLRNGYSSDSPFMICKVRVFKNQGI